VDSVHSGAAGGGYGFRNILEVGRALAVLSAIVRAPSVEPPVTDLDQ